jgi:hypothetical protein
MAALQDAGLLELHQHAVDGGQADVRALGQQGLEHVFGRHVALLRLLEDLEDRMRGSVAFRPLFLSSSTWLVMVSPGPRTGPAGPLESAHHSQPRRSRERQGLFRPRPCPAALRPAVMPLSFRIVALALPLAAGLLSGCTLISRTMSEGITSVITPYKVEVVQGNVVTKEMLAQVQPAAPATRCATRWARRCWPTPSTPTAGTTSSPSSARAPNPRSARS